MRTQSPDASDRRPIAARALGVSHWMTRALAATGIAPNTISVSSMVFGVAAGGCLAATGCPELTVSHRVWWLMGAGLILLRLLANMLDGMVAVEAGQGGPLGAIYNEVPDRVSDVAIFVGAGYATGGSVMLGLWASILAVLTAYVRAQGVAAGAKQHFEGPMAKPHRMSLVIVASIYCGATPLAWQPIGASCGKGVVAGVLTLIIAGCVITCFRRLAGIARDLRNQNVG